MPGKIVHTEIPADDTSEGREFWGSLFGWQFEPYPGPSEYHMARIGDTGGVAITNGNEFGLWQTDADAPVPAGRRIGRGSTADRPLSARAPAARAVLGQRRRSGSITSQTPVE